HARQQSSLIQHMEDLGLLDPQSCFQEFGCGAAEFTHFVQLAVGGKPAHTLLIDRTKNKLKLDMDFKRNKHERLLVDIKDLDLTMVDGVFDHPATVYSKHLCGSATDLTLRCVHRFQKAHGKVRGICIALCCHQVCSYERYINPAYLAQLGIDKPEFELLKRISTWGICGQRDDKEDAEHWTGMGFQARESLGLQAKRILDAGRLRYVVEAMGAKKAELVYYIDRMYSGENVALLCLF
ncbi:tRNA:m4X modification enzyme, partial [Kappamyces sp. JEL0680]